MVLWVDSVPIKDDDLQSLDVLYHKFPRLLEGAKALVSKKKKYFRPEGVLYARQKVVVMIN